MAGKGLGAGLGALFGEAALAPDSVDCVYLPIAKVEPAADQPRKYFDPESLAELAESIREHGIIQPLTVRKLPSGSYQIIGGERRWRAARQAGLTEVPVRILDADDRERMELALIENLQREDLNPVEEAEGYRSLMALFGLTQEEAAARVGRSRPTVTNALRLLALPEPVLELLRQGAISTGHARALLPLKDAATIQAAAEQIQKEGLSVRQTEALVKRLLRPAPKEKEAPAFQVDYVADVEKRLTQRLGRRVRLVPGKKKGRFEIEFYGPEDLEVVLQALEKLKIK